MEREGVEAGEGRSEPREERGQQAAREVRDPALKGVQLCRGDGERGGSGRGRGGGGERRVPNALRQRRWPCEGASGVGGGGRRARPGTLPVQDVSHRRRRAGRRLWMVYADLWIQGRGVGG